jgi:hypothetical protein
LYGLKPRSGPLSKLVFADSFTSSGRGRAGAVRRMVGVVAIFLTAAPALVVVFLRDRAAGRAERAFDTVFFFEVGVFFFDDTFLAATFFLLVVVRFFDTAFFAVFFLDVDFFEVLRFLLTEGRFLLAEDRFLLTEDRFLATADRFLLTEDRFLLAADRFLRLAGARAVLRTEVFFLDVFFLVAAFFAGIVALQGRLNETGDYTGARPERKALNRRFDQGVIRVSVTGTGGCHCGSLCSAMMLV